MATESFNDIWQGRVDSEDGIDGLRIHQAVKPSDENSSNGTTLIGLASDLGVERNQGRIGARNGPEALRKSLANLAWHFDMPLFDAGDSTIDANSSSDALADAQQRYADSISQALSKSNYVIGLGGGHEIAWGSYLGCRGYLDKHTDRNLRLGVLNFDAHFDLRKTPAQADWAGSSGTPFRQIWQDCQSRKQAFNYACIGVNRSANTAALFQFAEQQDVRFLLDDDCNDDNCAALIERFIAELDVLYVTICLDVLPASVAPGVSAPAALGIPLDLLLGCIKVISQSCHAHQVNWLMSDIAELNPEFDIDQRTARVAARLVYELIQARKSI